MDTYPPNMQRPSLLRFMERVRCRDNSLRRDECGDWRINGRKGHVYAVPIKHQEFGVDGELQGYQIFVYGETVSANWWNKAKGAMSFAKVTQDGDDEGGLIMDRLPTIEEGDIIRHYLVIEKKRQLSEESLLRLKNHQFRKKSMD